jgi:hypothetical protein
MFSALLDFKQRLSHASLILLSIFYLRISTLMFNAFLCSRAPDPLTSTASNAVVSYSLYLTEDLQTVSERSA